MVFFGLIILLFAFSAEGESLSIVNNQNRPKVNIDYFMQDEVAFKTQPNAQKRLKSVLLSESSINVAPPEIEAKIRTVFGANSDMALRIVACESSFNPKATNWNDAKITGMPSQGLFQINAPYNERLFEVDYNIQVAYEMFQKRYWQPWSCYTKK